MRSPTALRLAAVTLSLGLFGVAAPLATAAATAGPPAAAHYYDCDNTYEVDPPARGPGESVSIVGEGCLARQGSSPEDGVYVEDWGSREDWVCAQVDPLPDSRNTIGHGCRAVPKDSRTVAA